MKKLFLATGFLFLCGYAIGQAKDGTSELQKTVIPQPAALIYLPYSPEVVKKALLDYTAKISDREKANAKDYLLSSSTILVKNNVGNADMHFLIDLKEQSNKNEAVVYLKLNSFFQNENNSATSQVQFSMQDAKDYLDNLAIAIKPYATKLQLELQRKNLSDAQGKNTLLVLDGNKLEEKRKKLQVQIGENENYKKDRSLAKKMAANDKLIEDNLAVRLSLSDDIVKQITALALLTN